MDDNSTDFVIVMEDLSGLRALDQSAGVSADDALIAVEGLATFHATFADMDLSTLTDTFLPFDNPVYRHALPGIFDAGWPMCKEVASDLMPPEIIAFGDRFSQLMPFFIDSFTGATSLIHGDWRADNLMVNHDGGLAVIDFQLCGTGAMSYDLGYFLSQSMEPDVRRPANQAIIDHYYATLDAKGVNYDRVELDRAFKIATALCLIYPVANFPTFPDLPENMQRTAKAMLTRSIAAILDQGALDLLP